MKRFGWFLLVIFTVSIAVMAQGKTKNTKNEERLVEQVHYLNQLLQNANRQIKEYDDSNDKGTEIALWSKEKTISEAKSVLSKLLADRVNLRKEDTSFTLAYQARVRRWNLNIDEKKSHYDNLLRVLTAFDSSFNNAFNEIIIKELDTALGLKYYSSAYYLLDNYGVKEKESEERRKLLTSYLPRFKGSDEELLLEIDILELDERLQLHRLEQKITYDKTLEKEEAEWVRIASELSQKVDALTKKIGNNKYKEFAKRDLDNLLDNGKVEFEVEELDAQNGEVLIKILALIRSKDLTLYRAQYDEQYNPKDKKQLQSFSGIKVLRTKVKDKIPSAGRYEYSLRNPDLDRVDRHETVAYNKMALFLVSNDESSQRLMAISTIDGRPIEGLAVRKFENNKLVETLYTDKRGSLILPHSKSHEGYSVKITDERLAYEEYFYIPGTPRIEKRDPVTSLHFFTDRPMYRRGQEVKVGLLLTEIRDRKISEISDRSIQVKLTAYRGSKEEVLEEVRATTNLHGIAEVSVMIPEDAELSNYRLVSDYGTKYITVQDYKIQYLNAKITRIPKGYVAHQPLVIEGETSDLNGRPTAANVVLTYDEDKRIEVKSGLDGKFVITTPPVSGLGNWGDFDEYEIGWSYQYLTITASDALGNVATTSLPFNKFDTDMPISADILISGRNVNKDKFTLNTSTQPYTKRLLGDLSGRLVKAEMISVDGAEKIDLGELPIEGKKDFSLPNIKSGLYQIRLYTTDGYGKEVSRNSEEIYFYSESDKTLNFKKSTLIWGQKTEDGGLLYGSTRNTNVLLIKYKDGKVLELLHLPVEKNVLYRIDKKELKGAERVEVIVSSSLSSSTENINLLEEDQKEKESIKLLGLDFDEQESLLPGSKFSRTIKLTREGKALKNTPIIVTVFDKGVADAAGRNKFWSKVQDDYFYYAMDSGLLYGTRATSAPQMMRKEAVAYDTLEEVLVTTSQESAAGMDLSDIDLRNNFAETAFFSALLTTDEKGEVLLEFDLPDTETKYNIKVYSYEKGFDHQLISDHSFRVYSPLSIDLSMPRFLTWDDSLQGEVLLRNSSDKAMESYYQVVLESGEMLAEGRTIVPASGSKAIPFSLQAKEEMGEVVVLQAKALAGQFSDGIERRLPLISNLSKYIVATPISLYKQEGITIHPPKVKQGSSDALLELYLDPIMVLLTQLAHNYREFGLETTSLFQTVYQYNIYKRLELYLREHPDFKALLRDRASQLSKVTRGEKSGIEDRLGDPKALYSFFNFITDDEELGAALFRMEEFILIHKDESGGFRFNNYWNRPSPFLTSYILNKLAPIWKEGKHEALKKHLVTSVSFLQKELERKDSYYHNYIDFAIIAHNYGVSIETLSAKAKKEYQGQVKKAREFYQRDYTSGMLRFAEYSRIYDSAEQKKEVRQFIEDRCGYSWSDDELAAMKIFLAKDQEQVDEQLIEFLLKMKQGTLWHSSGIMDVSEIILDKISPSVISNGAEIMINGQGYNLTSEEIARGYVLIRYPDLPQELSITWKGVKSDYVFGGVRYFVTEPSKSATPTGEKLKVRKQIFVRQVSENGNQQFQEVTPEHPARKGDQLIIRYTIDTEQDLSLVTLLDPRPAGAEFGYDFEGFQFGDKLWMTYSRRDSEDRIYIDYLPRGQHTIELEATASNSGTFTYGPAQIQSYYAPEFAGNSAGGSISVMPIK